MLRLVERIADAALQRIVPKVEAEACTNGFERCCHITAPGGRWLHQYCVMCSGLLRCDPCSIPKFFC